MTQFWVPIQMSGFIPLVTDFSNSILFSTIFLDRLHTSPGHCHYTTSCSLFYLLSLLAFLINLFPLGFSTDIRNSTCLVRRMNSSLKKRFGCGLQTLCIIALCVARFIKRCFCNKIISHKVLFGFSVILFWGDLKQADGLDSGHWFWGTTLYLAVLLTVLGKAALISE